MTGIWDPPVEECQEPIAVVGMGCRWPGKIESPSELWDFLIQKKSGHSLRVPPSRFNIDAHYHQNLERPGSFNVSGGYFLDGDLRDFDPGVFGISPVEAMWLDPQQRKLLEVVYECLESAGVTMEAASGSQTGCFVGSFTNDYQQMSMKEQDFRHSYAATGVDPGLISNRISHVFNLAGPSFTINTACSSSVYALHQACNALRVGDCRASIVGGTNLILTVDQHINTAKLGVLSPTSQCHTFNAHADGYGRGEGVGALYLKRLSDAIRDGDPIRAVIRGSAVNSNGRVAGAGITHPSLEGQSSVIREAYRLSGGLNPLLTGYFECHGTGTAVGDPLEVEALSKVMSLGRTEPLIIGAVKASIGHCEAASGIAAVMKAVLAVEKGIIPPTYGFTNPNPRIKWKEWNVRVNSEAIPWPKHLPVRRASVNSFGYGGTNAHIIVEALDSIIPSYARGVLRGQLQPSMSLSIPAPAAVMSMKEELCASCAVDFDEGYRSGRDVAGRETSTSHGHSPITTNVVSRDTTQPPPAVAGGRGRDHDEHDEHDDSAAPYKRQHFLLPFSAHEADTLKANIRSLTEVAEDYHLLDLSYTLSCKRSLLAKRAFAIVKPSTVKMDLDEDSITFGDAKDLQQPRAAFVFTGQGAQWPTMGSTLMDEFPVFLQTIRLLDSVLKRLDDAPLWTLEDALRASGKDSRVHEVALSQPLCTAVQIGLLELLESWNITPVAAVGHSSGEIAAAHAAGLLTAAEAIIVAYYRGKAVTENTTTGAMLAVGLGAMDVRRYLCGREDQVVIACHNSSKSVTLSGNPKDIVELAAELDVDGIFNRKLKTDGRAYHSSYMRPCAAPYDTFVENAYRSLGIERSQLPPCALMVSSVTGEEIREIDAGYWSRNLTGSVLFDVAVAKMLNSDSNITHILELGPHGALAGPLRQIIQDQSANLTYESTLVRNSNGAENLLKLAGKLFLKNYPVDLLRVNSLEHSVGYELVPEHGELILDLPCYQWTYKKLLWAENRWSQEQRQQSLPRHDILGRMVFGVTSLEPVWRNVLRQKDLPWLKDHQIGPDTIFPGAGHWAMAMEAVAQIHETSGNPERITGFRLRDISIKTALVIPNDDDGVEVLFNMRKVGLDDGQEWFGFSVKSISNGAWAEHSSGLITALTEQTSYELPARISPALSHKSTGARWYKAFKEVGFNYGPSFQGIDGINSEPSRMDATANIPIRRESGTMKGESRYILHPSSIDNCLQLALISIYSGVTSNMTSGYVPVKAKEITIRVPQTEISHGRAYGRTTAKGSRSAMCFVQLTAGEEVILDINDLRVIAYDAAVPQKPEDCVEQPCWQSCWVPENRQAEEVEGLELISKKDSVNGGNGGSELVVVYRDISPPPAVAQLVALAPTHGYSAQAINIAAYNEREHKARAVLLLGFGDLFLLEMKELDLAQLKLVLRTAQSVVWVTNGSLSQGARPENAMVLGLKRSLMAEQAALDIKVIDTHVLDKPSLDQILSKVGHTTEDTEFLIKDGIIHVNRLQPHLAVNDLHKSLSHNHPQLTVFEGQSLVGTLSGISQPTIEFIHQRRREISAGCVEVEVKALGINLEDSKVLSGKVDHTNFGKEFSGIITKVANDVKNLNVGDSVCGICIDQGSTHQIVSASLCQKVEASTQEEYQLAASLPIAYTVAHHAIMDLAQIQEGENVLITGETGFAGHVAIRLAQAVNAKVYVTVNSSQHVPFVRDTFGLLDSNILITDGKISPEITHITEMNGFDVVFTAGSNFVGEFWRTIAPAGRMIQYGPSSISNLDTTPFVRGAAYSSIDIDVLYTHKQKLLSRIWKNAYVSCSQLSVQQSAPAVFQLNNFTDAIRTYSGNVWEAKHVVAYNKGEMVLIRPQNDEPLFNSDSSYLLVGCLGGLGRCLSNWMIQRGARSLVFLSRTGDDKAEAARLIRDISKQGCMTTVIRGDVSNKQDVLEARRLAPKPIRGIVQAATVFEDALFESLNASGFERSFKAKVKGTKNLHEVFLNEKLEFFIMTSSISATLGTPGQTNYAAANSYLDYLARHRQSLGLPAASLILPMILGVGYVSERPEIEQGLTRKGLYGIDQEELLRSFEIAVRGWNGEQPEVIVGLDPSRLSKVLQESSTADPFWFNDPRLSNIRETIQTLNSNLSTGAGTAQGRIVDRLRQEFGTENRTGLIETAAGHIKEKLSRMMLIDLDEISVGKSVSYYGVDSSIGTELRNWLFNEFKVDLSIQTMLSPSMSLRGLAEHLCIKNGLLEEESN